MAKSMKVGGGGRFKKMVAEIKSSNQKKGRKKMNDPAAVAAAIGRKKYGNADFRYQGL